MPVVSSFQASPAAQSHLLLCVQDSERAGAEGPPGQAGQDLVSGSKEKGESRAWNTVLSCRKDDLTQRRLPPLAAVLCAKHDRKPADHPAGRAVVWDGPQIQTAHVVRLEFPSAAARLTSRASPLTCSVCPSVPAGEPSAPPSRTASEGPSSPHTTWRRRRPCATEWPSWCQGSSGLRSSPRPAGGRSASERANADCLRRCIGSIQHLKAKYGRGYSLEVKLREELTAPQQVAALHDHILSLFPRASRQER